MTAKRKRFRKPVMQAFRYLAEIPLTYDATKDPLADRIEHAYTVNELLKHARALADELKA